MSADPTFLTRIYLAGFHDASIAVHRQHLVTADWDLVESMALRTLLELIDQPDFPELVAMRIDRQRRNTGEQPR